MYRSFRDYTGNYDTCNYNTCDVDIAIDVRDYGAHSHK